MRLCLSVIMALVAALSPEIAGAEPQKASLATSCPGNPAALGTTRDILIDPSVPIAVGLKTYPQTLDLQDHEVVLTFDDGPSPKTTPRVLEALEHECVRATFFLIGRNAQAAPALVKREIADGDSVGHHTWSHPEVTERGLTEAQAKADIQHGFAADDKAAYGSADQAPRVPFFRFPGFADTPPLMAWLAERHVAVFGADLWASDWVKQTPEAELALLMGRLNAQGRGIILLHDVKEQTAAMLPSLLTALKQGGYHIVAIKPGTGQTVLKSAPAGWSSETEKTVAALMPKLLRARPAQATPTGVAKPFLSTSEAAKPAAPVVDDPLPGVPLR
ncbi:polysaccharide deacetylase family protein [Lichenihabitans psoromatis]|uniref:polysaccharide deacetylase family protein n=1 Tax=Lichenihabitans psoromatis TaxID=2528642 RepID=UPI001035BDC9|nr:polysaccharide deacetylase family protein [Lichenihabitans psoromatis]